MVLFEFPWQVDWYLYVQLLLLLVVFGIFFRELKKKSLTTIFINPLWVNHLMIMVSLIFMESDWFISLETNRFGYRNYSSFYYFIFIIITVVMTKPHSIEKQIEVTSTQKFYWIYGIFIIILLSLSGFQSLTTHSKRGLLTENLPFGTIFFYVYTAINIAFRFYIATASNKDAKILAGIWFIDGILNVSVQSRVIDIAFTYLLRIALKNKGKINFKIKYLILGFGIIVVALFFRSFTMNQEVSIDPTGGVIRLAIQGQLFWLSINESYGYNNSFLLYHFINGLFFTFSNFPLSENYGLGHFMLEVGGDYAARYIPGGVTYAGGFPAIIIYYFGFWPGVIAFIVMLFIANRMIGLYIYHITQKDLFGFILLTIVSEKILYVLYMGAFERINLLAIFWICVYLVYLIFYRITIKRKINNVKELQLNNTNPKQI